MDKRRKEKDRQNCKNKQADKKPCTQTDRQTAVGRIERQRSVGTIDRKANKVKS